MLLISSTAGMPAAQRIKALFARKSQTPAQAVSESEQKLARDLYLKGRYEWNQRTPESLDRALDLFTQAIVHDPSYAQAYAGLADTYDLLREYSTMPDNDAFPRAIAAARKAVELDDSLAEAHRALAFAERYGTWDFRDAEKEFRRAIELDPNDPQVRRWYANAYAVPGRFDEALEQIDKAQELDPSSNATLADKGLMLFNAGRTQEGVALLKEVERSAPSFRSPHAYLARINIVLGDYSAFLDEEERTAQMMDDPVLKDIAASARAAYAHKGLPGLLSALYSKQKHYFEEGKYPATLFAQTCVRLGKRQEALQLLETAYARQESEVVTILSDPDLVTLREEGRYKALAAKINFPVHPAPALRDYAERDNPHLAVFDKLR
jgi:tetratricopeptide (TPR) repeat protein